MKDSTQDVTNSIIETDTSKEIPDFVGEPVAYFLPDGIWECTWEQFRDRFLKTSDRRNTVGSAFLFLIEQLHDMGLNVNHIYVDGSFVTARNSPGDVDACCVVTEQNLIQALNNLEKKFTSANPQEAAKAQDDYQALLMYAENPHLIKSITGTHFFIFLDEESCQRDMVNFFRGMGPKDNRPIDKRDPVNLVKPNLKGVLRVDFTNYFTSRGM